MRLGQLIEALKEIDPAKTVLHGFGRPMSYRGDYSELAFEPVEDTTIGEMLAQAIRADGRTFTGYKGGAFEMDLFTPCHIARYGECPEDSDITSRHIDEWSGETVNRIAELEQLLAAAVKELAESRRYVQIYGQEAKDAIAQAETLTRELGEARAALQEAVRIGVVCGDYTGVMQVCRAALGDKQKEEL
jgi:hypothetical protein